MNKANNVAIIFANGANPTHENAIQLLQKAATIICCDGGLEKLLQHQILPTVIVGDCDSISEKHLIEFQEIIHKDSSEEYNDLQKALLYSIANNIKEVTIMAAHGLREDHFLANIGIIMSYFQQIKITMITDCGIFTPISDTTQFESFPQQQISIFSFSPQPFSAEGVHYPIENRIFTQLWEGSLNEATGSQFRIICNKAQLLIYQTFKS